MTWTCWWTFCWGRFSPTPWAKLGFRSSSFWRRSWTTRFTGRTTTGLMTSRRWSRTKSYTRRRKRASTQTMSWSASPASTSSSRLRRKRQRGWINETTFHFISIDEFTRIAASIGPCAQADHVLDHLVDYLMGLLWHVHILLSIHPWAFKLVVCFWTNNRSAFLRVVTQHYILLNLLFFVNAGESNHSPLRVRIVLDTLVARFHKLLPNVLGGASNCILCFFLLFFLHNVTVRLPVRCQVVLREIDFRNCVHH